MTLPDIITMLFSLSLGVFAGWRVLGLRGAFGSVARALLPKRKKKKQVDAIADMVSWKRARRLEDQVAWQLDFDRLTPPAPSKEMRKAAKSIGWRTHESSTGFTQIVSAHGDIVLEWTSAGWVAVKKNRAQYSDQVRLKWLMDIQPQTPEPDYVKEYLKQRRETR